MGKYSPQSTSTLNQLNKAKAALNEQRYALGELQDQQARNRLELRQLTREYRDFSQGTDKATVTVDTLMSSLKRTAAEIGGLAAIKKFGSDVINATGTMQQLHVALSTILQDGDKASKLISEITQFAAKTPFNLEDVASGAKQLLAYGSSAETVVDELSMLGDVASGLQIPIGQLIYLYGTLRTQGRSMTVDIRQFAGRGIPIYEELAKVFGVTKDQVGELVTAGKVGFKEVEQAFKNMTSEGGKFNDLMENSAGTWPQRLSNIQDTLFQKLNNFGNKYKEVFEFGIGTTEELVEHLDDVISVIGGLIAAYGTYKAALIAVAVPQKAVGFVDSIRLIMAYRKQLGLATAAQQAFNLAAKSNVYVALLSVLVGLGTAIYMFTKRTNEATAAQEALSKVNKKADDEFSMQAATIDRLNSVLKSETASLDQKKKALSELQAVVPNYNASLNKEGELINNNTEAIKAYLTQLEKQIKLKAAQEELEELYRKKRQQEKQKQTATENYNKAQSLYNSSSTLTASALQRRGINTGMAVFAQNNAVNNQLKDNANKAKKELDDINSKLGETLSGIAAIEKEIEQTSLSDRKDMSQSSISKELENVTKRIKTLKQEIAGLRSGKLQAEVGKTVESAIKAKEKELKAANETLETLTGNKPQTTQQENSTSQQQSRLSEIEHRQVQERIRQQTDLENQVAQARIDAMVDGYEKQETQRKLDNEKELQAIDIQKQEYIQKVIQAQKEIFDAQEELKAKQNKNYEKKIFDTSSVSVDTSMFDDLRKFIQKRQTNDELKAQENDWNEYLIKFGDYQQKRQAIIEKYNKQIEEAQTAGKAATLYKEQQNALDELDNSIKGSTTLMGQLFADASQRSVNEIQKIIDKAELLMDYLGAAKDEQGNADINGKQVSKKQILDLGISENSLQNLEMSTEEVEALRKAIERLKGELGNRSPFKTMEEQLGKAVEKIKKGGKDNIAQGITDIGNAVSSFAPAMSQFGQNLGTIFGSDDLGNKIAGISEAIGGLGQTAVGVGQIMSGDIVGGVMGAVNGISSVISSLDGLFGADYSEYENMKARYDTLIDVWDTLIGKKMEYIDIDYGVEAQKAADEAAKLTETQISRQRQLLKQLASSGRSAGSHSLGVRIYDRLDNTDWERISKLVGEKIDHEYQLWDLSSEQIEKILTDEKLVSVLDAVNSDFVTYLQNIVDYGDQLEEIAEKEREAFTGISFDEFKDGFTDMLSDLDATNKDFADNFEQYLQNAVFSSLVANQYKDRIQKLYDSWSEYAESGGGLTPEEADDLRSDYQDIINGMLSDRNKLMEGFGWSSSEKEQQSASKGGFDAMTQDQATELSGRFTAVAESNYRIEDAVNWQTAAITEMRGFVSDLSTNTQGIYNIADETRSILANSYLELQQISENTESIIIPIQKIQKDIEQVKQNTSRL